MTYQQLWVPSRWTRLWEHVCQLPSRWRKCWRSRLPLRWSCLMASDRRAECHAPGSTAPSMHCPSGRQPAPHGWRCTHAGKQIDMITTHAGKQIDMITTHAGKQIDIITTHAGKQIDMITTHAGKQIDMITTHAGKQIDMITSHAGKQTDMITGMSVTRFKNSISTSCFNQSYCLQVCTLHVQMLSVSPATKSNLSTGLRQLQPQVTYFSLVLNGSTFGTLTDNSNYIRHFFHNHPHCLCQNKWNQNHLNWDGILFAFSGQWQWPWVD